MTEITRREFSRLMGAAAVTGALPSLPPNVPPTPPAPVPQGTELVYMPATELATRLKRKDVSAREVLSAHIAHIERVNPKVNAIVTTSR
jgi:amidase